MLPSIGISCLHFEHQNRVHNYSKSKTCVATYIIYPQPSPLYRKEALLLPRFIHVYRLVDTENILILNRLLKCKLSETKVISFRIPLSSIEGVNETINKIGDSDPDIKVKGDVLLKLINFYEAGGSTFKINVDDPTIQNVIDEITKAGCDFLKYEDESIEKFQCYETMMSKRKPTPLSPIPERTLQRCVDCIKGKLALKQLQYEKKLEKDMVKKILNFRDMLMTMVGEGFVSEVYFCTGEARHNQSIIFSNDNITLPCSLNEMELVKIEKVCMNTVNPKTNTTPCKYLIMDKHIAKLKKKDFKTMEAEYEEVREVLPQLEHQEPIETESKEIQSDE